jgi:hypothetical protein
LQTLNQGSKSCADFLKEAKACLDLLSAVGYPIEEDDLISYILVGLNPAYTTFVTLFTFSTRTSTMSFEDFQAELLNHEMMINNCSSSLALSQATLPSTLRSLNFPMPTIRKGNQESLRGTTTKPIKGAFMVSFLQTLSQWSI